MKIFAVCNQKGGVGKTTTSLSLAAALAEQGNARVLAVDLDPQGSLTTALGIDADKLERTIYDVLASVITDKATIQLKDVIIPTQEGFDLVPANIELSQIELDLVNAMKREMILDEVLSQVKGQYDYVIVDCLPSLGLVTINALAASDEIIIPLQAEFLAMKGVRLLLRTIGRVQAKLNPRLKVAGILITMVDIRTLHAREVVDSTRKAFEGRIRVFDTIVKTSVKLRESPVVGQSVLKYSSDAEASKAYRSFALELIGEGK